MTAYATATDYATYLGVADDYDTAERARINAGLLRAQDDIDAAIVHVRYDPSAEQITDALTRATCARFQYHEETGDETGALDEWDAVRIASVSLSRSSSGSSTSTARRAALDSKTANVLRRVGLLTQIVGQS